MKTQKIKFIFILILLTGISASAQNANQCMAIITEINGDVFIKQSDSQDLLRASWGSQVFEGDEIKTTDKSDIKLLFSNSNLVSLGPNSTMKISGKEAPLTQSAGDVKNISSAMIVDLSAFTSKREEKSSTGALAGLRSGSSGRNIEPGYPNNTLIKNDRPSFSWSTLKTFDNYVVNLYNSKGLVWSRKVSENNLKYPENEKGLSFGESYFWNVEGEYLIETEKSDNNKFTVLSADQSKIVTANENLIRDAFRDTPESCSMHSVLGAYYMNNGLLLDAINEFQTISKMNAGAAMPHEILGSLYSEVGEKDKAIDELHMALTLAKGIEK